MRVKEISLDGDYEINTGFIVERRIFSFLPIYKYELLFGNKTDAEDYIKIKRYINPKKTLKVC